MEQPFAALHRRRSISVGRHHQDTALTQQTGPAIAREAHTAEVRAVHLRNVVVPGQPFVEEGVLRTQQVRNTVVLAHLAVDEHPRFLNEGSTQLFIKLRKSLQVRLGLSNIALQ